jgi:hypothetical protein
LITIEKNDIQTTVGEDDSQRKADVTAPADNDNLFRFLHESFPTDSVKDRRTIVIARTKFTIRPSAQGAGTIK